VTWEIILKGLTNNDLESKEYSLSQEWLGKEYSTGLVMGDYKLKEYSLKQFVEKILKELTRSEYKPKNVQEIS